MASLTADNLFDDPRVRKAIDALLAVAREHGQKLTGPRPADPSRRASYEQLVAQFNELRGGPIYYPYLGSGIGRGPLVELADGSVKYDMISGIGVHHLGHSHPAVMRSAILAALRDTVMQGNLQQDVALPRLSRMLAEAACESGAKLNHCFLSTSGAMANENGLKLALQKKSPAHRVLAFEHCFMGRTLAMSQITDNAKYRQGLPTVLEVDYVPFFDAKRPKESVAAAVGAIRSHIARHPGQHALMCLEMVQGEGGYYAGDRDFFLAVIGVLKEQHLAVLVDEVQTFGRTSRLFAFQHFGLDAHVDIVTIGKLSQACATLFTDEYRPGPGLISQTFTASTSALFAAEVVIGELRKNCLGADGRNAQVQQRFARNFTAISQRHAGWVAGPFGLGGMVAFTPLSGTEEIAKAVAQELFNEGVIGFVAGRDPTPLRFLPPMPVVTDQDIDAVCEIVERILARVAAR